MLGLSFYSHAGRPWAYAYDVCCYTKYTLKKKNDAEDSISNSLPHPHLMDAMSIRQGYY